RPRREVCVYLPESRRHAPDDPRARPLVRLPGGGVARSSAGARESRAGDDCAGSGGVRAGPARLSRPHRRSLRRLRHRPAAADGPRPRRRDRRRARGETGAASGDASRRLLSRGLRSVNTTRTTDATDTTDTTDTTDATGTTDIAGTTGTSDAASTRDLTFARRDAPPVSSACVPSVS